jgi:CBS domain-containing protein
VAVLDPASWLRATPPFDALPQEVFDRAASALEVGYYPAGTRLVQVGGEPLQHLYLVRKGAVRIERDGQTLQVLEEGESFGFTSLLTGKATLDVWIEDDLLAYRLPGDVFRTLLADAHFAGHFAVGLSRRLRASLEHASAAPLAPELARPVRDLLRGPAVWVEPGATVGGAAGVMREHRISSVLVSSDPPGIVTDRDFRNRVLAEGRGADLPVTEVYTAPLVTVAAGTPVHEAWTALLDAGVHHLPVVEGGKIVGVLTGTDLLRCSATGPLAMLRRVERLGSRDELPAFPAMVTELATSLAASGLDAVRVAGFVARLGDALLLRLVRLAEADLGPVPAPFAWLALGSEGRMEPGLLGDQDNALVHAGEGEAARAWFARLADRVCGDLERAGFPPCPGGFMARRWNGPLEEWTDRLRGHLDAPSPEGLVEMGVFLDFRRVAGSLDVAPLEAVRAEAGKAVPFLRALARVAAGFKPPGFLLRLRGGTSEVDLKREGLAPIVLLARCYGLEAGASGAGTVARLEAAAAAGLVDGSVSEAAADAYRSVLGIRLRLQLAARARGATLPAKVPVSGLTAVERSRLKSAVRVVGSFQERAARHFRLDG